MESLLEEKQQQDNNVEQQCEENHTGGAVLDVTSVESEKAEIKYQGRKASRASSELRRKAILEAALRIVVSDGVRGVRHRAVAKEADVPLSATTYYFKDIDDLITDAFTLFVENTLYEVNSFWEKGFAQLSTYPTEGLTDKEIRQRIQRDFTEMGVEYVVDQIDNQTANIKAALAFNHECVRNERLWDLAKLYHSKLEEELVRFFGMLQTKLPVTDAKLVVSQILRLQYQELMKHTPTDREEIRLVLGRLLSLILEI